jgi:hypothetical protein
VKNHDRFESLAGAMALGEATIEERAAFAAHAAGCALCRQDVIEDAAGTSPLAAVGIARDDETWRPAVDRAVVARIREGSAKRSRLTVGALGWGAALSIAVNVAFITGINGQLENILHPATEVAPVATFGIRLPARTFAKVAGATHPQGFAIASATRARAIERSAKPRSFAATLAKLPAGSAPASVVERDDISDLLAADTARAKRNVAIEISFPANDANP